MCHKHNKLQLCCLIMAHTIWWMSGIRFLLLIKEEFPPWKNLFLCYTCLVFLKCQYYMFFQYTKQKAIKYFQFSSVARVSVQPEKTRKWAPFGGDDTAADEYDNYNYNKGGSLAFMAECKESYFFVLLIYIYFQ